MKTHAILLAGATLFGAIGLAFAAEQPPGPPKPDPAVAALEFLAVTAHCTGTQNASDFGPAHATKATFRARMDLNGFWLSSGYYERKTKANPAPFHVVGFYGYDPGAKQLIWTGFDSFGGRASETSPGLDKNQLVFTGDLLVGAMKLPFRETYTKLDGGGVDHMSEFQGKDGAWVTLNQTTCKAAPAKPAKK